MKSITNNKTTNKTPNKTTATDIMQDIDLFVSSAMGKDALPTTEDVKQVVSMGLTGEEVRLLCYLWGKANTPQKAYFVTLG